MWICLFSLYLWQVLEPLFIACGVLQWSWLSFGYLRILQALHALEYVAYIGVVARHSEQWMPIIEDTDSGFAVATFKDRNRNDAAAIADCEVQYQVPTPST